jgi:hypothetical protein
MSKQWRWTRQPLCPHLVRSHVDAVLPRLGLGGGHIGGGQLNHVCGNGGRRGHVVVLALLVVLLGPSPASVMVEGTGSDLADCPVPQSTARECHIATWKEKLSRRKFVTAASPLTRIQACDLPPPLHGDYPREVDLVLVVDALGQHVDGDADRSSRSGRALR